MQAGASAETEEPTRGSMAFKIIIRILLALTVGVSVFAVKAFLFGDHARSAQPGDCINGPGKEVTDEVVTRAKKVPCGSADAHYVVAGDENAVFSSAVLNFLGKFRY